MLLKCLALIALLHPLARVASAQGDRYLNSTGYKLLRPPQCGFRNTSEFVERVIGGDPAQRGDWPWVGALGYRNPENTSNPEFRCGATLITAKHVLTAARCALPDDLYMVRFGVLNLSQDRPVDIEIENKFAHPEFNAQRGVHDIAVLTMVKEALISERLYPICLPIDVPQRTDSYIAKVGYVVGWGTTSDQSRTRSDVLMQTQVPVISNTKCREDYNEFPDLTINNFTLCAGFKCGGRDAGLEGDNGGPLMIIQKQIVYQIGVVSYRKKCKDIECPTVYARVTEYIDFINSTLNL